MTAAPSTKRCVFRPDGREPSDGRYRYVCIDCGLGVRARHEVSPASIIASCNAERCQAAKCIHRGAEHSRLERCETCCGNVRLKIFPCAIHGECSLDQGASVTCCPCEDYEAAGAP